MSITAGSAYQYVNPKNVTQFREAFETYTPNTGGLWNQLLGSGDLVLAEGNALGASYLDISKSPFNAGTETIVETAESWPMPIELSLGIHRSQNALGQEFSVEVVDDGTPISAVADIAVSAISQSTTTLTVTTAAPHGLSIGQCIGIYGCVDSRFNYASLVVASVNSTNTNFTCTAGPNGAIPSVTATPSATGVFVYVRRRLGLANDGTSMIFESATATSASFYFRSNSGDAFTGVTGASLTGNHSATVSTNASVALFSSPFSYTLSPTSEYRLQMASDKIQWFDSAVDVATGTTQRVIRTSVCPSPGKRYRLRFRGTNNKGLTVPNARVISATKSGTTTATVVFDRPHGYTTNDQVVMYGSRNQTDFPNNATPTAVLSVVSPTSITVAWGATTTGTGNGGFMARAQGGQAAQGVQATAVQSASITNGVLTLVGAASWSGLLNGDFVNFFGGYDTLGVDANLDGVYRVANSATTSLDLVPIGGTVIPTTLSSINIGGGVIRRTCNRVSWARIFSFSRERVEFATRPQSDLTSALPVQVANTPVVTATNLSTNVNQIGAGAPAVGASSGSSSVTLSVNTASAISSTDQNATAFAGAGRVNGTVVASARGGSAVVSAEINVTTLTLGTATSVVFVLQESSGGTNFTDIWFSDPITATGIVRVPPISVGGRRRWCAHSVGGTSTTVTATITALELPPGYPVIRQYRDSFSATNPLASVINSAAGVATTLVNTGATCMTATTQATAPLVIEGCNSTTLHLVLSNAPTVTTQPVLALEFSQDGTNWFTSTATVTAAGNGTYSVSASNLAFRFVRCRVTTAAVYSVGNYTIASVGITSVG
jgi:hypothetical protein